MNGVPVPKYRLALLGRFELSRTDGPVELPNKKLAALLAYLACAAPEPQLREKLATLLWGSHFETQARQNLRQALFRLRRALGEDALIGGGDEVWLAPGVIDCDVTRLEASIREGSQASLAAAVDLYTAGASGVLVGQHRDEIVATPLHEVVTTPRSLDPRLLHLARVLAR